MGEQNLILGFLALDPVLFTLDGTSALEKTLINHISDAQTSSAAFLLQISILFPITNDGELISLLGQSSSSLENWPSESSSLNYSIYTTC